MNGKSLIIALVFDLAWLMGSPAATMGPDPRPPVDAVAEWPTERGDVDFTALGELEDSLMLRLQQHPKDVDAIQEVASFYVAHGWYESAIGPLARALQLDPSRRSLWVALDRAVERSGRIRIMDADLTKRAAQFVEAVSMWGHGC